MFVRESIVESLTKDMKDMKDWKGRPISKEEVYDSVGPGWRELLEGLLRQLFDNGWDGEVHQVKEKFGGLRFYTGESSEEIERIISVYEGRSREICEECGKPGKVSSVTPYWLKCVCDECMVKVRAPRVTNKNV